MHGKSRTGMAPAGPRPDALDPVKPAPVKAFEIGQVAGRPLYLVIGADAAQYITPGLPFNDD